MVLGINKVRPFTKVLPKPITFPYKINETIPRLLLRRDLLPKYPILRYILCEFTETMEHVRANNITVFDAVDTTLELDVIDLGFTSEFIENIKDTDCNSYVTAKSLLIRLLLSKKYIRVFSRDKDWKNAFRMQLYADTHIDLCIYMSIYGRYDDASLLSTEGNEENAVKSVLEDKYPHDERVIYWGDMPDITPLVDVGNIWYDIRPRADTIVAALVHVIVSKTQPHKCQLRNFARILYGFFGKFPILVSMFRNIVAVGLLGNYPHAEYRPSMGKRIQIVHAIRGDNLTDSEFFDWISKNERLTYYLTKEFYVALAEQQYILDKLLKDISHWTKVKEGIKKAMDTVRSSINRTEDGKNHFGEMEAELKNFHEQGLNFLSKLRKMDFCEMVYTGMTHFTAKKKVPTRKNDEYLTEEEQEYIRLLGKHLSDIPPREMQIYWVKCFMVTEKGYSLFMDLYYRYEVKEEADHAMTRHLNNIYMNNERDFYVIYEFVKSIVDASAFKSFTLSHKYAVNQINAIRKSIKLAPWEDMEVQDDLFFYCPECEGWKSPYINDMSPKTHANTYAQGLVKTLYDKSGSLYCGKKSAPGTNKKNKLNGITPEQRNPCINGKLVAVNMIGKLQRLDNKLWALCEICGHVTQWEGNRFSSLGFTCIMHRPTVNLKDVNKMNNNISNKEMCFYCHATETNLTGTKKETLIPIRIIDDDSITDLIIKDEYICSNDYQYITKSYTNGGIGIKRVLSSDINKGRMVSYKFFLSLRIKFNLGKMDGLDNTF